ncbi:MAG: apolipoprotein N-acyltransferase [Deltaproteobacteria bacterium]|nr:apolipoprotein N-acyltransferase [Deltaproteobacteria bacterium]
MAYLAALISGLLAAISFPTIVAGRHLPNLSWLAWVALVPYWVGIRESRGRLLAFSTFLLGLFWNGLTSYWIFNALYFNGQLSWPASLGVLAFMSVTMGALLALFVCFGLSLSRRFRLPAVLVFPAIWVFYECFRNYAPFGGYPWSNLGYSQASWLTLLQSADLFGVYGISFLVVLVNVVIGEVLDSWIHRRRMPRQPVFAAIALLLAFLGYGVWRLRQVEASVSRAPQLAVGVLQPNIGQQMKWKTDLNDYIQGLLFKMTQDAIAQGADFVIWPESSLPTALPLGLTNLPAMSGFSAPVLLGALSLQQNPLLTRPMLYNSAVQVDAGGRLAGRLHKQHLVPLGEYVPLKDLLWFVEPIVPRIGDFRTLIPKELLRVHGHPYGVVICYEDLFPEISRNFTRMGATFLVNITNDAWYGDSSQLEQHLNFSRET